MNNNDIIQEKKDISLKVTPQQAGQRIDIFLAEQLPIFSRSIIKKLLTHQQVLINYTTAAKPSYSIKEHDTITFLSIPTPAHRLEKKIENDLGIMIIAEEQDFLIIYKPAGIVVHPPQQTFTQTALTDWLVRTYPEISHVGDPARPGIVHRLDRNTSGIMIVARNQQAHETFSAMFKDRSIKKTYIALVIGHPKPTGTITYFIGRHPVQKNLMHCYTALRENNDARDAMTEYTVLQTFKDFSLVQARPKTGRTHQIRVHFKGIGHPLLGDELYGTASKLIPYHALHAQSLSFTYQQKTYHFTSELSAEIKNLLTNAQS